MSPRTDRLEGVLLRLASVARPDLLRPEILLTDDPPRHTQVRAVIANALCPRALDG